jgi:hypothetical protein
MAVKVTIDIPEQALSIILSTPERFSAIKNFWEIEYAKH